MLTFADLDPDQQRALLAIEAWIAHELAIKRAGGRHQKQVFRLFGYAGTGKTAIIALLQRRFADPKRMRIAAYTGKAAHVLRLKGCLGASTIHQLFYRRSWDGGAARALPERMIPVELLPFTKPAKIRKPKPDFDPNEIRGCDLVVLDECSMIDRKMGLDLLASGLLILVLGDPAQLPPVSGEDGFFLRAAPDVLLTAVHRQNCDNPVLDLATQARRGEMLRWGQYGASVVLDGRRTPVERFLLGADQIICGLNSTRQLINRWMRDQLGRGDNWLPIGGDKLICLRNNYNHRPSVLNGSMWMVEAATPGLGEKTKRPMVGLELRSLDMPEREVLYTEVPVDPFKGVSKPAYEEFYDQFDFGYGITAHKAQGSEWPRVAILDQHFCFRKFDPNLPARWLYTALTRARDEVAVINYWSPPKLPDPPTVRLL